MYQQFLVGERYLKKQNQQKGKTPLIQEMLLL